MPDLGSAQRKVAKCKLCLKLWAFSSHPLRVCMEATGTVSKSFRDDLISPRRRLGVFLRASFAQGGDSVSAGNGSSPEMGALR